MLILECFPQRLEAAGAHPGDIDTGDCHFGKLVLPQGHQCAAAAAAAKSLQSCPTLCDPIDGRPLGSSVPRILQARILEWVAISLSIIAVYFDAIQFSDFPFCFHCMMRDSPNNAATTISKNVLPMFSFTSFMVLVLPIKSLLHFEFILHMIRESLIFLC